MFVWNRCYSNIPAALWKPRPFLLTTPPGWTGSEYGARIKWCENIPSSMFIPSSDIVDARWRMVLRVGGREQISQPVPSTDASTRLPPGLPFLELGSGRGPSEPLSPGWIGPETAAGSRVAPGGAAGAVEVWAGGWCPSRLPDYRHHTPGGLS